MWRIARPLLCTALRTYVAVRVLFSDYTAASYATCPCACISRAICRTLRLYRCKPCNTLRCARRTRTPRGPACAWGQHCAALMPGYALEQMERVRLGRVAGVRIVEQVLDAQEHLLNGDSRLPALFLVCAVSTGGRGRQTHQGWTGTRCPTGIRSGGTVGA